MKNEEKLLLAIGEISDDIISEAEAPYKRRLVPTKKTLAIAASVAVVAVGITLLPGLLPRPKFDVGDAAPPEMNGGANGGKVNLDVSETGCGRLECTGRTDGHTFSFILTLYTDLNFPLDVTFKAKDGSIVYTTEEGVSVDTEIRRPTITVNGEAKDALPTLSGEYDITISFDGMEESREWQSYISFNKFGIFYRFGQD